MRMALNVGPTAFISHPNAFVAHGGTHHSRTHYLAFPIPDILTILFTIHFTFSYWSPGAAWKWWCPILATHRARQRLTLSLSIHGNR